jgi:hypothetical protein
MGSAGHVVQNFCFCLHPVGYADHVVHSSVSGAQNIDILFFILGWAHSGFHKRRVGTRYAKLVFLHLVATVGHIGHPGAFGVQNIGGLFFMLGWAWCGLHKSAPRHITPNLCFCMIGWGRCNFYKKHVGTHYDELVFLHPVGSMCHVMHSRVSRP